ncbi:MAG: LysR family transcriptional regulator [Pseudomonadota bacterium]
MRLDRFDMNQLVCLDALLTEKSVTRVAEQLNLSQSAVSWSLNRLREHFEDPLFVRSGRNVVPTPFAESLAEQVRDILERSRRLSLQRPNLTNLGVKRRLRIMATEYTSIVFLVNAVKELRSVYQNLSFEILPLTPHADTLLERGELDLLIAGDVFEFGRPPNLLLLKDDYSCIACKESWSKKRSFSLDEYTAAEHIIVRLMNNKLALHDTLVFQSRGIARREIATVSSFLMVPPLILKSKHLACIPTLLAKEMSKQLPIKVLPCPIDSPVLSVNAYWHESRSADPILEVLINLIMTPTKP